MLKDWSELYYMNEMVICTTNFLTDRGVSQDDASYYASYWRLNLLGQLNSEEKRYLKELKGKIGKFVTEEEIKSVCC
ncbi:MAG: hypothetical protein ACQESA_03590 [Patescibacteria group bacterium]